MNRDHTPTIAEPWFPLDDAEAANVEVELRREISADHALSRIATVPIARRFDRDDVLLSLDDGRWATVHLTWSPSPESGSTWPSTTFYGSAAELQARLAEDARKFGVE
jgi:hypothetical protein